MKVSVCMIWNFNPTSSKHGWLQEIDKKKVLVDIQSRECMSIKTLPLHHHDTALISALISKNAFSSPKQWMCEITELKTKCSWFLHVYIPFLLKIMKYNSFRKWQIQRTRKIFQSVLSSPSAKPPSSLSRDYCRSYIHGSPYFCPITSLIPPSHSNQKSCFWNIKHIMIRPWLKPSYGFQVLLQ
jgi:hypothetical protein